jgi:serine/threonine-protein phosphatase PGAM5
MPRRLLLAIALLAPIAAFAAPAGTRYLYLVRHGDYDSTAPGDPAAGPGLNELGREQAALVAARLAAFPVKFDTLVTSQLARARETGDLIAPRLRLPVQRDGDLSETRPPGDGVPPSLVVPGAAAQLERAWARYVRPAPAGRVAHDLLICHGNVIRWFLAKSLGADSRVWSRMEIGNTSITVIEVQPDGTTNLLLYNDTSHLPLDKQSWVDAIPDWLAAPDARR